MPFYRWDGTELVLGEVSRWDGTALQPGVVKQHPWTTVEPPPPGPITLLDGGAPLRPSVELVVDGGAPDTTVAAGSLIDSLSTPAYVGHRFGRFQWHENTYYAANQFFAAFPSATSVVGECDLQLLSDGDTMVLNHDSTVTYAGTPNVAISSLTPAQWDTVTMPPYVAGQPQQPAAFWDHPSYPSKSVAALYGNSRILMPELKNTGCRVPLMDWIDANDAYGSVIVQYAVYSTSAYSTHILPMASAGIATAVICYSLPGGGSIPSLATMASDGVYAIVVSTSFLAANPTLLANAHAEGIKVHTFNSNTASAVTAQAELGVDGIMSDAPTASFPATMPPPPSTSSFDGGEP